jgi:Predicted transcriptional regulators
MSMLFKKDCYGYDVSDYLSRHIDISEGSVYPILRKLKGDGLVTTYLSEESGGPPRKYYHLTELGKYEYRSSKAEWQEFAKSIEAILKEDQDGQK